MNTRNSPAAHSDKKRQKKNRKRTTAVGKRLMKNTTRQAQTGDYTSTSNYP